ncbi:MAG: hypothetical protein DRQ48_00295 [Gammaproteobacteria bacterium]|nr:MAG: hypothetical protein DRQ48_00295 [Gammaproteobacteria bacterium]
MKIQDVLAVFYRNDPRKIEGNELHGWCGLEGEGYIADVGADTQIVMDIADGNITLEVHTLADTDDAPGYDHTIQAWTMKVTAVDMGGR